MGGEGSFSQQASELFSTTHGLEAVTHVPLVTAEKVLSTLEAGEIDRGVFPIENSNGGIVLEAVYAMATHRFEVTELFELDVHHMLLVRPGTQAEEVTAICSHDQALKQCRMYLRQIWPTADVVPYADTAKAAEALANGELPSHTAVIASRKAAELFGLEVLEESIQDLKFNYTSFVVAGKK